MLTLGLVLVVMAMGLALAEAHLSTGGVVATGAGIALIAGAVVLLANAGVGAIAIVAVAVALSAAVGGGLLAFARSVRALRGSRPRSGIEAMIGHVGVLRLTGSAAKVFVDGGLWRAQPSPLEEGRALHDGDRVVVERVTGLTLCVRRAEEWELNP
jgi:membrane-bound ClpP family serine protease